ncbi:hypothetical protein [Consotaella aegiceratis]|uniref:hypothetical protein n=1 Tax=Consotaella aegiceratis TaxID=3097961 RepID=UPI002F4065DE
MRPRRLFALVSLASLSLIGLSGCMVPNEFSSVERARQSVLGFSKDDVVMCAGFPTRTRVNDDAGTEIWSYEFDEKNGGATVTAPLVFGLATPSINYSSGGDCKVQFLFIDGRVRRLAYAGDNDAASGRDTLCAPVIDDCVSYADQNSAILARRQARLAARSIRTPDELATTAPQSTQSELTTGSIEEPAPASPAASAPASTSGTTAGSQATTSASGTTETDGAPIRLRTGDGNEVDAPL